MNRSEVIEERTARVLSYVFHPVLMPVYGLLVIFSAPTVYTYIPFGIKKLVLLIVLVNNLFLPLSLIPFLIHSRLVSSWQMVESRERVVPLLIMTVLYIITAYIISRFPVPQFLKSFFLSAAFLSLTVTLINFSWKISVHSVGTGALLALVMIISFKMFTPVLWYLIVSILAVGFVLASRLRLNYHNPTQVWAGLLTGFLGLYVIMTLFQ